MSFFLKDSNVKDILTDILGYEFLPVGYKNIAISYVTDIKKMEMQDVSLRKHV